VVKLDQAEALYFPPERVLHPTEAGAGAVLLEARRPSHAYAPTLPLRRQATPRCYITSPQRCRNTRDPSPHSPP